jgi:hypothetical protein
MSQGIDGVGRKGLVGIQFFSCELWPFPPRMAPSFSIRPRQSISVRAARQSPRRAPACPSNSALTRLPWLQVAVAVVHLCITVQFAPSLLTRKRLITALPLHNEGGQNVTFRSTRQPFARWLWVRCPRPPSLSPVWMSENRPLNPPRLARPLLVAPRLLSVLLPPLRPGVLSAAEERSLNRGTSQVSFEPV